MFVVLACKVMVRVMVEVRVTITVPVRVRVRDQKPISRDCSLASELVQALAFTAHFFRFQVKVIFRSLEDTD